MPGIYLFVYSFIHSFLITEIEEYAMEVLCKVRNLFSSIYNAVSILSFSLA